jgi:DNA-binding MarR family transcriptional regulator/GNAT superfamily N-acetyltransferase
MSVTADQIARVRAFNRDYTRRIGVLGEGLLDSPYSLTEVRVMYEVAHRPGITAGELTEELGVDKGYMSRILKRFEVRKLVTRQPSAKDGRRHHLRLTPFGKKVFTPLDRRSQQQVRATLSALDQTGRDAVLGAMSTIQSTLSGQSAPSPGPDTQSRDASELTEAAADRAAAPFTLRVHQPGDMGWVVERHGAVYFKEYGWNREFEALVAEIAGDFLRNLDPARERCWIAERDGQRVGCVLLTTDTHDESAARLRLLLVEPQARGIGLGRALVAECIRFAKVAGYRKLLLWTQENLSAARRLYADAGFIVIARWAHHSFGRDLVAETWELALS